MEVVSKFTPVYKCRYPSQKCKRSDVGSNLGIKSWSLNLAEELKVLGARWCLRCVIQERRTGETSRMLVSEAGWRRGVMV